MPLFSSFSSFLEPGSRLLQRLLQLRDGLRLAFQDFLRLADVFQACLILFAQLAELRAAEEELCRTHYNKFTRRK